jgi:signal peptidase II
MRPGDGRVQALSAKAFSLWGPYALAGLTVAIAVFGIDQAHKVWMLFFYHINDKQPVEITSFFDLRLVWNEGVSYGWLKSLGPWVLIVAQLLICGLLWFWVVGAKDKITALATGAIIGGAMGNIFDRLSYGAVADFFHLHAFGFSWYVFNLADVAIVAGAMILVYGAIKEMTANRH